MGTKTQGDNDIFSCQANTWWSDDGFGALIRYFSNPWRVPYFQRIFSQELQNCPSKSLLDMGCGGGLLAEEFASMGFVVTGIDPSEELIEIARDHAAQSGLKIDYFTGYGEKLSFENETFEVVACCDVLDHIQNWEPVIGEVARVLKRNGIFVYDTINRTTYSKRVLIEMAQENESTCFMPPNLHTWDMFIKPEELEATLERYGLENKQITGTKPVEDFSPMLKVMQAYNAGNISTKELAQCLSTGEGSNIEGFYMGYAIKP